MDGKEILNVPCKSQHNGQHDLSLLINLSMEV